MEIWIPGNPVGYHLKSTSMRPSVHFSILTIVGAFKNHRMKPILIFLFSILTISAYGQDKYNYIYTKKPIELKGTEYVLSRVENWGKMFVVQNQYLLFINTQNGQSKKVDFPKECRIQRVEQIEIDSLQINKIIVMANTLNLDNSKHLDGGDPMQIFLLSINGEEKALHGCSLVGRLRAPSIPLL